MQASSDIKIYIYSDITIEAVLGMQKSQFHVIFAKKTRMVFGFRKIGKKKMLSKMIFLGLVV